VLWPQWRVHDPTGSDEGPWEHSKEPVRGTVCVKRNLLPGHHYDVCIQAMNEVGFSGYSRTTVMSTALTSSTEDRASADDLAPRAAASGPPADLRKQGSSGPHTRAGSPSPDPLRRVQGKAKQGAGQTRESSLPATYRSMARSSSGRALPTDPGRPSTARPSGTASEDSGGGGGGGTASASAGSDHSDDGEYYTEHVSSALGPSPAWPLAVARLLPCCSSCRTALLSIAV
jgi:hypothetical protein